MVFVAATMTSVASAVATPELQPGEGTPIEAIWRVQEFVLHVQTPGRYYSCSSLEAKIISILEAVGAGDVAVELTCSGLTGSAVARIATLAPVPADADSVRQATTFDARSELIARLRGTQLPTPENIDRFLAQWRTVSLGRGRPVYINPQDCDLLKGISRQILPHLSVEIVEERLSCDHVSRFPITPKLVVKALTRTV